MNDSLDKIKKYFEAVKWGGKGLRIGPSLLRGTTCPPACAGCCPRVSLDYLPSENRPTGLIPRVKFGRTVYSDLQRDNDEWHCKHVDPKTGRCRIHEVRPFSCDFELIRFRIFLDSATPNLVAVQKFGRGWALKRVDGNRGALCEMAPITDESIQEVRRKFVRLEEWAIYFGIETCIPAIIEWLDGEDHSATIV